MDAGILAFVPRPSSYRLALPLLVALALAGCPERHPRPDAGVPRDAEAPEDGSAPDDDGGTGDAGRDDAGALDAGTRDAGMRDGGVPTGDSEPAPPAEVLRPGTGGFLLRGTVLAPSGPISPGEVLIVGNTITCVAADCSGEPMADTVTVIDTHAVISPGLIDGHNHATYNFLPEWIPDPLELFGSRYDWRADPDYREHVRPEADGGTRGDFVCPSTKWAELRSIVHGTTTIQGQSPRQACIDRLARNADHAHGLGTDHMQTTIAGPCESGLSDAARVNLVNNFRDGSTTRYAVHMAEGVTGNTTMTTNVLREYDCYAGRYRYTTSLLFDSDDTPFETAMFIHAVTLTDAQLVEAAMANARFVWSPSSNILLYGGTAPIGRMLELGLKVGLGPDWTLSGSDEMLSELRFAEDWALAEGVAAITPAVLHRMATEWGADAVGLEASIGQLAPSMRADVAVFGRVASDPYRAVVDSRAADVRLVMIDGVAYYGDLALEGAAAVNGDCETLDACGTDKFLCAANTPVTSPESNPPRPPDPRAAETVEDIRGQLRAHLASYGRQDELLELVDCSL